MKWIQRWTKIEFPIKRSSSNETPKRWTSGKDNKIEGYCGTREKYKKRKKNDKNDTNSLQCTYLFLSFFKITALCESDLKWKYIMQFKMCCGGSKIRPSSDT